MLDADALYGRGDPPPPAVIHDRTPIVIDYPRDLAFARGLQRGRLDLWNPLAGAGAPLWAEQGGPFFPLKLPFYLAPSRESYNFFLASRLVFAAFGAYLLARANGLRPVAAVAAGASFEMSGALLAQLPFGAASPPYVLPWIALGALAIARRPAPRSIAGAAVALGLAANGGHPTLALMTLIAFTACVAGHVVALWRRPRAAVQVALCSVAALLLGLALAAPSLLPLADLTSVATSYKYSAMGTFIWNQSLKQARRSLPVALFAPATFDLFLPSTGSAWPYAASVGFLGLVAAVAGLRRGLSAGLGAVLAVGLVMALQPPGSTWMRDVPGLNMILPAYAWSMVALPVTQAIGRGVESMAAPRGWRAAVPAMLLVLAGSSSLLWAAGNKLRYFGSVGVALASPDGQTRLVAPALFAVAVLAACAICRRTRAARFAALALTVSIAAERLMTALPVVVHPKANALELPPSPPVEFLQRHLASADARMVALPFQLAYPLTPMLFGLPDLRSVSALPVLRFWHYLRAADPGAGVFTMQKVTVARSPLFDLGAVRYVVAPSSGIPRNRGRVAADNPALPVVYRDGRISVRENPNALSRFRIVHDAERVADDTAALNWARDAGRRSGSARELGLAESVVLEPDESGGSAPPSARTSQAEHVRLIAGDDPDRLLLEAELEQPGFLVIADTYHPGWRAWVDGVESPIFPANLMFRAVHVAPGRHIVELRYAPRSFALGVALFAIAAVLCAAALVAPLGRAALSR